MKDTPSESTKDPTPTVKLALHMLDGLDGGNTEAFLKLLGAQAEAYKLTYLLAYHDDGVVWGVYQDQQWLFSSDTFRGRYSPPLRAETLQECRAFGPNAELLVWRDGSTLKARVLVEGAEGEESYPYLEQTQVLWGTEVKDTEAHFTLLREGRQGLEQAIPLTNISLSPTRRACLTIRDYIAYRDNLAYVHWSRLVNLEVKNVESTQRGA